MSTGIFSIGTSALSAAYTALRTAGNNVANANTPGYTRQTVVLSPQVGAFLGGSYVGQGVAVSDVRRVYNDFLTQQAHQAQSAASQSETRYLQLSQVSNLFADPTTGIGASIDNFFSSIQDLTQRPADPSVRQAVLSSAGLLQQRFTDIGTRLQDFRNSTDRQLRLEADAVNRTALEVADLNDKISLARGAGRDPNDLLDRRDAAIRKINESVRVSVVEQDDGSANLFLGNGQPLVVGSRTNRLGVGIDALDPQQSTIGVVSGSTLITLNPNTVGGGKIGGLLQFRNRDLPVVENELGRLAINIGEKFNEQHRLGNDRNGVAGGNFFTPATANSFPAGTNGNAATTIATTITDATQLQASDYRIDYVGAQYVLTRQADGQQWTSATPTFTQDGLSITLANTPPAAGDSFLVQATRGGARNFGVLISQPTQVAAANPVQVNVPSTNVGTLTIDDLSVVGPTRNPALTNPVSVVFTSPTAYEIRSGVTVLSTGAYTSGTPITFNGWSLTVRGTPNTNDQLNVSANISGVGDNRNAIKLTQLSNMSVIDGGTLANAFSSVVARVGGETQSAEVFNDAQTSIFKDAVSAESSVAGVNLDEEASRLIQYQQQYQAAAKVIQTASTIFEEILGIAR